MFKSEVYLDISVFFYWASPAAIDFGQRIQNRTFGITIIALFWINPI